MKSPIACQSRATKNSVSTEKLVPEQLLHSLPKHTSSIQPAVNGWSVTQAEHTKSNTPPRVPYNLYQAEVGIAFLALCFPSLPLLAPGSSGDISGTRARQYFKAAFGDCGMFCFSPQNLIFMSSSKQKFIVKVGHNHSFI